VSEPLGSVGHVILPVADVDVAARFFEEVLGLPLRFRDGDRYAAFDAGGATLALASAAEQPAPGRVAVALRVADVEAARARLAPSCEVGEMVESEHERRVSFTDPDGNTFVVYESR
jgi:predicted enzyme related to lactoylglutathione lyase